ncbi:unnamed protein product, partial [Ixodes hexagonus]
KARQPVEQRDRKMWTSDQQLILSCVSIAVGLGNIWRFPKVLYENGGGSFLVAYTAMLVLVGYPLLYLELIIGQYTRLGPSGITRCVPLAKGKISVEISIALVSLIIAAYFQAILAQALLQLFLSFTDFNLAPISGCYGFWELKAEACFQPEKRVCGSSPSIYGGIALRSVQPKTPNRSRIPTSLISYAIDDMAVGCVNVTETVNEHFFHLSIGLKHHHLGGMTNFHPELMICLGLMWALLFVCSTTGVKTTKKKWSLVGLVPVVLATFLMANTLWQQGAIYGIMYMLVPTWRTLLKISIWTTAVEQVFFTFGIASGPLLVYGSYNNFFANIHRAVLYVTIISFSASLTYGIVVFGSLGALSWKLNIPVEDIVHGGHSVIFVAMNKYSLHWTLSTVFFVLVIVTGTNSQVGLYLIHLVDTQVVSFMLVYIAAFELVAVMWIYGKRLFSGLEHLKLDIMLMHGELSAMKLEVAWCIILPAILAGTVVTSLLTGCSSLRLGPIEYPVYACYIGWSLIMLGALQVPLWAVASALKNPN